MDFFNELSNRKCRQNDIKSLNSDSNEFTSDQNHIFDEFNNYFYNIGKTLADKIKKL